MKETITNWREKMKNMNNLQYAIITLERKLEFRETNQRKIKSEKRSFQKIFYKAINTNS